jgi:hypothetical protein
MGSLRPPVLTWLNHSDFLVTEFLESELSPERTLPIYFNHHYKGELPEGKVLYYNVEQLTRPVELSAILALWAKGKIEEVWDYSEINCAILTKHSIPNRYIPFTLTPKRLEYYKTLTATQSKEYDIGFCGAASPRREIVLKGLREAGLRVLALHTVWGEERDKQLAKCKVILNIHYAPDYQVFERTRCEQWLSCGTPVISEHSLDNDPRAICLPYEELVDACVKYVKGVRVPFCACGSCGYP